MRWSRFRRFLVWSVLLPGSAVAEHSSLLPRPQQIRYEDRRVAVRGLSIRLPNDVTAEDRFAADTLSNCLTRRALSPVRISQGRASISVISLKRTGPVDALPMPGEQPGPSSREAYFIKVTVDGGEIQAASSAGLFYGAATLCQLIKGECGGRHASGSGNSRLAVVCLPGNDDRYQPRCTAE